MKRLIIGCLLFSAGAASYAYVDGGLSSVSGANGYYGINAFGELGTGSGLSLRPAISTYKTDSSGGTFATYSARLGYDNKLWGVGAEAGATPKVNGYKNAYATGDFSISLLPSGERSKRLTGSRGASAGSKGEGLARIDAGGGLTVIRHSSDKDSSGADLSSPFNVTETDMFLSGGVVFFGVDASARYTKNLGYSQSLGVAQADPQKIDLAGMITSAQGFMSQSWTARVDIPFLPFISPYGAYTFTQFKVNRPSSQTYVIGATAGLKMININAAYQIYDPGAGADSKGYFSVGAGLNF